jgi:hypothetical protein
VCASAGSYCIIFSNYVDHSLKMSPQVGKKRAKWSGERKIVYNVYKFMKNQWFSVVLIAIYSTTLVKSDY